MLSVRIYRVMDARWSLESTKNERVARGAAESNSRFLSVLQTSQLGSSSLVSSIFQREGKLHCSLTLYRASMRAML